MSAAARIARFGAWLWLPVVLVTAGVVYAMVASNESSGKCMQCHHDKLLYNPRIQEFAHLPYKEGRVDCVTCHTQRSEGRHMRVAAVELAEGAEEFTTPRAYAQPARPTYPTDAECIACHYRILEVNDVTSFEGRSEKLAAIGLRFDHRTHYRLKDYTADDHARYVALKAKEARSEDEQTELDLLAKVRISACALCHQRDRVGPDGDVVIDKAVNYFTVNPLSCFACHPDTAAVDHPGNSPRPATERQCRTCHNGKLHGRIPFFVADKNDPDTSQCAKCHPRYTPPVAIDEGAAAEGDSI